MKVLVTGAFGNIGRCCVDELLRQGHSVRCFDLKTKANMELAKRLGRRVQVVWGDLRRPDHVEVAVSGQDVVIHLAAIIPPASETSPSLAEQVNVGGTRNLLEAAKARAPRASIIFASSVSVFGKTQDKPAPRTASDPVEPTDNYSRHKVACEEMVRLSGLDWTILRIGAAISLKLRVWDPGQLRAMFEIPLDTRIEFVHPRDVGLAAVNAVTCPEARGRILLIGGGPSCQVRQRQFVERVLRTVGVGMLPERAFSCAPFYTDWLDTAESQRMLRYQRYTLDQFVAEATRGVAWMKPLIWLCRPSVRYWVLRQSPSYGPAQVKRRGRAGKLLPKAACRATGAPRN